MNNGVPLEWVRDGASLSWSPLTSHLSAPVPRPQSASLRRPLSAKSGASASSSAALPGFQRVELRSLSQVANIAAAVSDRRHRRAEAGLAACASTMFVFTVETVVAAGSRIAAVDVKPGAVVTKGTFTLVECPLPTSNNSASDANTDAVASFPAPLAGVLTVAAAVSALAHKRRALARAPHTRVAAALAHSEAAVAAAAQRAADEAAVATVAAAAAEDNVYEKMSRMARGPAPPPASPLAPAALSALLAPPAAAVAQLHGALAAAGARAVAAAGLPALARLGRDTLPTIAAVAAVRHAAAAALAGATEAAAVAAAGVFVLPTPAHSEAGSHRAGVVVESGFAVLPRLCALLKRAERATAQLERQLASANTQSDNGNDNNIINNKRYNASGHKAEVIDGATQQWLRAIVFARAALTGFAQANRAFIPVSVSVATAVAASIRTNAHADASTHPNVSDDVFVGRGSRSGGFSASRSLWASVPKLGRLISATSVTVSNDAMGPNGNIAKSEPLLTPFSPFDAMLMLSRLSPASAHVNSSGVDCVALLRLWAAVLQSPALAAIASTLTLYFNNNNNNGVSATQIDAVAHSVVATVAAAFRAALSLLLRSGDRELNGDGEDLDAPLEPQFDAASPAWALSLLRAHPAQSPFPSVASLLPADAAYNHSRSGGNGSDDTAHSCGGAVSAQRLAVLGHVTATAPRFGADLRPWARFDRQLAAVAPLATARAAAALATTSAAAAGSSSGPLVAVLLGAAPGAADSNSAGTAAANSGSASNSRPASALLAANADASAGAARPLSATASAAALALLRESSAQSRVQSATVRTASARRMGSARRAAADSRPGSAIRPLSGGGIGDCSGGGMVIRDIASDEDDEGDYYEDDDEVYSVTNDAEAAVNNDTDPLDLASWQQHNSGTIGSVSAFAEALIDVLAELEQAKTALSAERGARAAAEDAARHAKSVLGRHLGVFGSTSSATPAVTVPGSGLAAIGEDGAAVAGTGGGAMGAYGKHNVAANTAKVAAGQSTAARSRSGRFRPTSAPPVSATSATAAGAAAAVDKESERLLPRTAVPSAAAAAARAAAAEFLARGTVSQQLALALTGGSAAAAAASDRRKGAARRSAFPGRNSVASDASAGAAEGGLFVSLMSPDAGPGAGSATGAAVAAAVARARRPASAATARIGSANNATAAAAAGAACGGERMLGEAERHGARAVTQGAFTVGAATQVVAIESGSAHVDADADADADARAGADGAVEAGAVTVVDASGFALTVNAPGDTRSFPPPQQTATVAATAAAATATGSATAAATTVAAASAGATAAALAAVAGSGKAVSAAASAHLALQLQSALATVSALRCHNAALSADLTAARAAAASSSTAAAVSASAAAGSEARARAATAAARAAGEWGCARAGEAAGALALARDTGAGVVASGLGAVAAGVDRDMQRLRAATARLDDALHSTRTGHAPPHGRGAAEDAETASLPFAGGPSAVRPTAAATAATAAAAAASEAALREELATARAAAASASAAAASLAAERAELLQYAAQTTALLDAVDRGAFPVTEAHGVRRVTVPRAAKFALALPAPLKASLAAAAATAAAAVASVAPGSGAAEQQQFADGGGESGYVDALRGENAALQLEVQRLRRREQQRLAVLRAANSAAAAAVLTAQEPGVNVHGGGSRSRPATATTQAALPLSMAQTQAQAQQLQRQRPSTAHSGHNPNAITAGAPQTGDAGVHGFTLGRNRGGAASGRPVSAGLDRPVVALPGR